MSSYQINPQHYNKIFALPTVVIDRYLPVVCGYYLKVLLYFYRHAEEPSLDQQVLEQALSLSKDDVHEALEFWKQEGLLISSNARSNQETEKAERPLQEIPADSVPVPAIQSGSSVSVKIITDRPPTLSSKEIAEKINQNHDLQYLFSEAEQLFGRPLTTTEQRSVISMREWMNLPTDVIVMIFGFCKSMEKTSIRYIEKVAANWCDLGITTHELAEEYIARALRFNEQQKAVRDCCGIHTRNLTSNEKKLIEIWFEEYGFQIDMIQLAFEKTADNIGKISFAYMNKILKQWHEQGITTPQMAKQEAVGTNRTQASSYDLNALDRIGLEIPEL